MRHPDPDDERADTHQPVTGSYPGGGQVLGELECPRAHLRQHDVDEGYV
jgi:acetyl esterase/lipase